ncbi:MAG: hypothetical protein R3F61_07595 [Myxococcota bacterium]
MRAWMLVITALAGCGTPWIEEIDGGMRRLTTTLDTNGSGNLKAIVRPYVGDSSMLVTVQPLDDLQDCHIRTLQVGADVPFRADQEVVSDQARTNAGYIGHAVTLNWPIAEDDGFLRPNANYKVQAGIVDSTLVYTRGQARVSALLKQDADFSSGTLHVNVIYAGDTGSDSEIVEATDAAFAIWRNIYEAAGIELDLQLFDYPPTAVLAPPGQGDADAYRDISASAPFGSVNLVIVRELSAGFEDVFGFSGDIPGPLVPSGRSAVAVSAALHAGGDGRFSAAEIQILAETMAHETGHYLGLFHPVETTFDSWDALADTPDCGSELNCLQSLGTNVMFPFPICDAVSCVPQTGISPQQGGVMNRYTGVR